VTWISQDGQWRVCTIQLNGRPLFQVKTRGLLGWIWKADVPTTQEVSHWVPLENLKEAA
jgi:hypothetical protein